VNSTILPTMTFAKTSQKFGQWADHRVNTIYGLGFNAEVDLIQFMEKFNEVKEFIKTSAQSTPPESRPAVVATSNGSDSVAIATTNTSSPDCMQQNPTESHPVTSVPISNQLVDQLKYDNERLKIALAQSSANAKKWEQDLQTLRHNNTRLTTALQESNTNVEEWKKQLAAYRDENTRLKTKLAEIEKSSGSADILQQQLTDYKAKLENAERLSQHKDEEMIELKKKVDELKLSDAQSQKLTAKIQLVEDEKLKLRKQISELQQQLEQTQSASKAGRQQLLTAQQQLSAKINELYEMNDKLADLLQTST
jgi:homer protein